MEGEIERMIFFEHNRKQAEDIYAKNPLDAENLVRWGGALIELSQFQQNNTDSKLMLADAVTKLEEALSINPQKHDAMWCLANAYTTLAFINPDMEEAKPYFEKAAQLFQQAADEEPTNELYMKSLEVSSKAPELHAEIHKQQQALGQQGFGGAGPASTSTKSGAKKKKSSDFKYDVAGWVILAVGIVAWLGFAKNNPPPQYPR